MARAQAGDREAYRQLLASFTPVLRRYFRRRVTSPTLVEDLVQDTLLAIHRARHAYLPDQPFAPWGMTIARNALLDQLRKGKRITAHETAGGELPEQAGEEIWHGDADVEAAELLARLPVGQRDAVKLTKLDGLSVADAARSLGITESALKVRVHRALAALKHWLLVEGGSGA